MVHLEVALHAIDPAVPIESVLLERDPDAVGMKPELLAYLLER